MYDITISSDAGRALGEFMFDLYRALLEVAIPYSSGRSFPQVWKGETPPNPYRLY